MRDDRERTLPLVTTRTVFEADTIAAALQARGVNARVIDAVNAQLWSGAFGNAKVIVLEHEREAAMIALDDIKRENVDVKWADVEVESAGGASDDASHEVSRQARLHRRWVWTAAMLMLPVGFVVLATGTGQGNPMIQSVGGCLLAASLVMAVYMLMPDRPDQDPG